MPNPDQQERLELDICPEHGPQDGLCIFCERPLQAKAYVPLSRVLTAEQEVERLRAALICGPFGKTWQEACEEAESEVERLLLELEMLRDDDEPGGPKE